jgi:hypothetical protein
MLPLESALEVRDAPHPILEGLGFILAVLCDLRGVLTVFEQGLPDKLTWKRARPRAQNGGPQRAPSSGLG